MSLRFRVEEFVAERDLLARDQPVVVGVSGGVDSVTLLHVLAESGYRAVAAHVNYGLRGEDSDADEALVRALCAAWGVPLHVERATLGAGSVQAAARAVRYRFFGAVAAEAGAPTVATAHHRDDQAETLLLNLFRGTGPAGLAGMPVRRPLAPGAEVEVVRPLLGATRAEIVAYAREHGLPWREDASNRTGSYRRTALRESILPAIEAAFGGGVRRHLADTADLLRAYLDSGAALAPDAALDEVAGIVAGRPALSCAALRALPEGARRGLVLEALRRWAPEAPRSAATAGEVEALLDAQPGRRIAWPGLTVWRDREHLVLEAGAPPEIGAVAVALGRTETALGTLDAAPFSEPPVPFDPSPTVEYVDADRLRVPLVLRPWREGDALRPLGLDGRKRVSDLLTERKVPPQDRARQLVLLDGSGIVWVVGHRLAERVRVRPETRAVVRLAWNPAGGVDADRGDA